jgi:lysophospholipase L1-like esterase
MTRTRWADVAAIALAVAVIVGLGFALRSEGTATLRADPSTLNIERPQPAEATRPSVLYIGDSYTLGRGSAEMSYACQAAVRMGWFCILSALPGTGYISGGPANRFVTHPDLGTSTSFIERIPHLAAVYEPDVVILDGGRNDLFPPREDVFKAMTAMIQETRRAWPKAKIVFIRPRLLDEPGDDLGFDDNFIARLKAEPAAAGVVFIDPISRFTDTDTSGMLANDGIHPNQRGYLDLASALVGSLLGNGFAKTS